MTDGPFVDLRGTYLELDVGAVAHGGHCVARHEGRVVFVRHTLPGERVRAVVTDGTTRSRFLRADAVEVLTASPDRVPAPCPHAGPGACGGCDWQHVAPTAQRALKAHVVAEQLRRLAGVERDVVVEELPGSPDALGWRTRVRYAIGSDGRPGLRAARSHRVVPVDTCLIATPEVRAAPVTGTRWPDAKEVEVVAGTGPDHDLVVLAVADDASVRRVRGRSRIRERAAGRDWQVSAGGFWQVHPAAADALAACVVESTSPRPGDRCLDLYSGVGLFAATLAGAAADVQVVAVEADVGACTDARRNLHDLPSVRIVQAPVKQWLAAEAPEADLVVLDPPRTGAGADVVRAVVSAGPRTVVYVACDPAALARDLRTFADLGYGLGGLRAFDLFPMTQHVECVATLVRDSRHGKSAEA